MKPSILKPSRKNRKPPEKASLPENTIIKHWKNLNPQEKNPHPQPPETISSLLRISQSRWEKSQYIRKNLNP